MVELYTYNSIDKHKSSLYNLLRMERILEPELMDDWAGAKAYAESDFSEPHNAFVARFKSTFPRFHKGAVADLGCGTADPAIRLANALPDIYIHAVDGSGSMLHFGSIAVLQANLGERIALLERFLPKHGFKHHSFDAIISNSLLHHLPNPYVLWRSISEVAKPNAPIFVMDLTRPPSEWHARELVELHSPNDPALMKEDFYNSLLAAFRPEEVRSQLDQANLPNLHVEVVSDRHMIVFGNAPH